VTDIHEIDAEFQQLHGVVKFRGNDQKYMMIAANKAASNAKVLREAASLISTSEERPKVVAEWLNDLAGKFERCEDANG